MFALWTGLMKRLRVSPKTFVGHLLNEKIRGQSRVLTHFKISEKFGEWPDICESNTLGRFTM
jgi:hypothetical protein